MKILIYGDSNTWGWVPNINGYSKNYVPKQYNLEDIWWYPLTVNNEVIVNGLPGRAINNDNPWLEGRNASKTIIKDLNELKDIDLMIVQLGTNDCKSRYNLSAEDITDSIDRFLKMCRSILNCNIVLISPALIKEGNKVTDKYYLGAEEKSRELDLCYRKLAQKDNIGFVSSLDLDVGEDGEHLTLNGHKYLSNKVVCEINKMYNKSIR